MNEPFTNFNDSIGSVFIVLFELLTDLEMAQISFLSGTFLVRISHSKNSFQSKVGIYLNCKFLSSSLSTDGTSFFICAYIGSDQFIRVYMCTYDAVIVLTFHSVTAHDNALLRICG